MKRLRFVCETCHCFHFHSKATRFKTPQRVIEELQLSRRDANPEMVLFFDDTFTLQEDRASEILDRIISADLGLKFHCFTRADTLNHRIVKKMRRAGFVKVTMGVESGSQEMLDRFKK